MHAYAIDPCIQTPNYTDFIKTEFTLKEAILDIDFEKHRATLERIAHTAMLERGLLPDFSAQALAELARIKTPASISQDSMRDLRELLWVSIDNDDSLDLDQTTTAEEQQNGWRKDLCSCGGCGCAG